MKPAEYLGAARQLEEARPEHALRLAVLSSFSAELLKPYVIVESDRLGVPVHPWFGAFGQFEQLVLPDASPLWTSRPDVVWLALRLEDLDPRFVDDHPAIGGRAAAARIATLRERLVRLAQAVRERSPAAILVSNLTLPAHFKDPFDASDPDGLVHLVAAENRELARGLAAVADAHVFDHAGVAADFGRARLHDPRLWYMARAGASAEGQAALAAQLARTVAALARPAAKCIVVDLDGTLWGGVVGDDGLAGLQLGEDYPGNVFKELQAGLLWHRRRGTLLAICSKNDEETVGEALRSPEMLLRPEDFACVVVSWQPKPANLRRIAERLRIGLDAIVFVDDNPVERAAVRAELPMVHVVELPPEPTGFLAALRACPVLDRPRVLDEDRRRGDMLRADEDRLRSERGATSVAQFLAGLEMTARVGLAGDATFDRVHQLVHKTNQFNLTTRRHARDELGRLAASQDARVAWLRLADRFGDLGLVCVGIVRRADADAWEVDTLLMSCRVMGRGVEDAFLAYLAELAAAAGARRLIGRWLRTARNRPVATFYAERAWHELCGGDDERVYERVIAADHPPWPAHIRRLDEANR
jgi:FkbH-like protein